MTDLIERLAAKLDGLRFDHIVGIPRGGLLVASLLAYRMEPCDVGVFAARYSRSEGEVPRVGIVTCAPTPRNYREFVLLVEDGTATGTLMEHARRQLLEQASDRDITTAALWVSKSHDYRPDVWLEEVDVLPSARDLFGGVS